MLLNLTVRVLKERGRQRDPELNMESGSKTSKTSILFIFFPLSFEVEKEVEETGVVDNGGSATLAEEGEEEDVGAVGRIDEVVEEVVKEVVFP